MIYNETLLIGTYNVDPRSANLNSEILILCRGNKDLASDSINSINQRIQNSVPIIKNNKTFSDNLFLKSTFDQKIKFLLAIPLASLFDFLL